MSDSPASTRLRALLLAAGCAAVLGLAACGGGNDSSTTTSSTIPAGATGASSTVGGSTTDSTTTSTTGGTDSAALRDQFNQALAQVLISQQGLTQSQAQCAIKELDQSVSDTDLQSAIQQMAQNGTPPQSLIDSAFQAGKDCAGQ